MNKTKSKNRSSVFKGVYFDKKTNKWVSRIYKDGKKYHLGCFDSEIEAA